MGYAPGEHREERPTSEHAGPVLESSDGCALSWELAQGNTSALDVLPGQSLRSHSRRLALCRVGAPPAARGRQDTPFRLQRRWWTGSASKADAGSKGSVWLMRQWVPPETGAMGVGQGNQPYEIALYPIRHALTSARGGNKLTRRRGRRRQANKQQSEEKGDNWAKKPCADTRKSELSEAEDT